MKVLTFFLLPSLIEAYSYFCELECGDNNFLCVREPCRSRRNCGTEYKLLPLTKTEITDIVKFHNTLRNNIAGKGLPNYRVQAADMMTIVYDQELEFIAKCLANGCTRRAPLECLSSSRYRNVSFNYFEKEVHSSTYFVNLSVPFKEWQAGIKDMDKFLVKSFYLEPYTFSPSDPIYQATNLIWSWTEAIGCAKHRHKLAFDYYNSVVCVYGPNGGQVGESIYTEGKPCQKCKCDKRYKNLCINNVYRAKFVEAFAISGEVINKLEQIYLRICLIIFVCSETMFVSM